ncbi:hypothetical protein BC828DRAFT_379515 [Blastocladiella britannica]|nr:hypothetical protein BC828DRAFT_379515 [Blastocladiella britannica]
MMAATAPATSSADNLDHEDEDGMLLSPPTESGPRSAPPLPPPPPRTRSRSRSRDRPPAASKSTTNNSNNATGRRGGIARANNPMFSVLLKSVARASTHSAAELKTLEAREERRKLALEHAAENGRRLATAKALRAKIAALEPRIAAAEQSLVETADLLESDPTDLITTARPATRSLGPLPAITWRPRTHTAATQALLDERVRVHRESCAAKLAAAAKVRSSGMAELEELQASLLVAEGAGGPVPDVEMAEAS